MTRKKDKGNTPRLYNELAEWFHLLTAPEDYQEEAAFYYRGITENSRIPVKTVLELGSGGGNNASHLKHHWKMTLTDLSDKMLAISRRLNPECEHIQGDMRNIRLGRQFDAVFTHDAISYITTEADLAATLKTAFIHCKPGGAALFAPDYVRETLTLKTKHGGHDGVGRGMRYLEWTRDPDPADTTYIVDFAYLLREGETVTSEYERHTLGLFAEKDWLRLLKDAGFTRVKATHYPHKKEYQWKTPVFIGVRPKR